MKKGFTLAEVLITLGIIGVIVAIMLPLINKARPVSEKSMYLKTYDSIVSTVHSLANNKSAFPVTGENNFDYSEYPLLNLDDGAFAGNTISGEDKLRQAILMAFNAQASNTTPNGITFKEIKTQKEEKSNNDGYSGTYETTITFVLPNKQEFKVFVYADGKVVPADDIGAGYINTRTNWFKRGKSSSSNSKQDNQKYTISCVSGYTFNNTNGTCELSGGGGGKDCTQAQKNACTDGTLDANCNCIPNNSCTTQKQQAQALKCKNTLHRYAKFESCDSCGDCLDGYTEKGGLCTKSSDPNPKDPNTDLKDKYFNWKATGSVTYQCATSDSLSCHNYNNGKSVWHETRNFEMVIIASSADSEETKDQMVIKKLRVNVGQYITGNNDIVLGNEPAFCGCTRKTYINVGSISYENLGSAIQDQQY